MSLTATLPRSQFIAAQNQVLFPYGFKILSASELGVYKNQSLLVLQVHYTVTGVGQANGGNVVMFSLSTAGDEIVIVGSRTYDQAATYIPSDPFPAAAHEAALDKVTRLTQQVKEELNRAVTLRVTSLMSGIKLPEASSFTTSQGGKKAVVWNTSGNQLELAELVPPGPITGPLPTGTVNILDYGAIGDGVFDNATVFAAAMSAIPDGGEVIIPPGIYAYTGTITLNKTMTMRGANSILSILRPMTTNVPGILVNTGFCTIRDLMVQRTIKPVAGGDGIVVIPAQSHNTIERVRVSKGGYRGIILGSTDTSFITQTDVTNCESHGIVCDYNGSGAVQWQMTRCLSISNVGDGYHCINEGSGVGVGPFFVDCVSFNNGMTGFYFSGLDAARSLNDVLMLRCLSSTDAAAGVTFDNTYGNGHMVSDTWIELVGMASFARGFDDILVAPTLAGDGLRIVGNNGAGNNFVGGVSWANSWSGIRIATENVQVVGFTCFNNGQAVHADLGNRAGIAIAGNSSGAASCTILKTTGNDGQLKGIVLLGTHVGINIHANKFVGYSVAAQVDTSLATIGGALPVAYPLGLMIVTDRVPFMLKDDSGGPTPTKFVQVKNGSLVIINNAFTNSLAELSEDAVAGQTPLLLFDPAAAIVKRVKLDTSDLGSGAKKYLYLDT